jgi:transposase InsO family protein
MASNGCAGCWESPAPGSTGGRKTAGARAAKAAADAVLTEQIRTIHTASARTYGVPRITAELREAGTMVNHKRVERLMREHRIVGVHLRRKSFDCAAATRR